MIIPQESKESPIQIESERTEDNEDNTKTQTFEKIQTNEEQYIFGNHISIKHPHKMGELITLLFIKCTPIIVIGLEKSK